MNNMQTSIMAAAAATPRPLSLQLLDLVDELDASEELVDVLGTMVERGFELRDVAAVIRATGATIRTAKALLAAARVEVAS